MILSDKIIALRKKQGWSQEELAAQLGVSRQSVSKWEMAQSMPDLDKLLAMSELFSVSTDYLLKEEMAGPEASRSDKQEAPVPQAKADAPVRHVGMAEAEQFLKLTQAHTPWVALGVALCIISPIPLLMLSEASELGWLAISENNAGGIGLLMLMLLVAPAIALFVTCGLRLEPFEYLEKEPVQVDPAVMMLAAAQKEKMRPRFIKGVTMGVVLCVLSVCPLFLIMALMPEDLAIIAAVCLLLGIVALGVGLCVAVSMPYEAVQKLLEEGDYTRENKRAAKNMGPMAAVYWLAVTAVYLYLLLGTEGVFSQRSWVIWPVAGVLFAAVCVLFKMAASRNHRE